MWTTNNPPSKRMQLANVVKGRIVKPVRVLVYGPEGIGKSTFAAAAPAPIFLGAEDGTSELNVQRFPQPHTWIEVLDAVAELTHAAHNYQTFVVDTLNWIEPLCWAYVCALHKFKNIKEPTYGKGYAAALDEWRVLLAMLERLRNERGMMLILLAHSHIRTFRNPESEDFGRYTLKLNRELGSLFCEWSDVVMYAQHETFTHVSNGRARGVATGARVLCTQRTAAYDAKNRHDLPEQLPLDWQSFATAMSDRPLAVQTALERELERATQDVRTRASKALDALEPDDWTKRKEILIHLMALNIAATPKESTE